MQIFFDVLVTAICIKIIAQYAWSLRHHFRRDENNKSIKLLMALVGISAALFTYFLWTIPQPTVISIIATIIIIFGDIIFWWAILSSRAAHLGYIFNQDEQKFILQNGVYAYIRHPFYASYILFWAGWAAATWHPLSVIPVGLFIAIYYRAAKSEEEAYLKSQFARDYLQYSKKAGLFWPRLTNVLRGQS